MSRKRGSRLKDVDRALIRRGMPAVERPVESPVVTPPEFDGVCLLGQDGGAKLRADMALKGKQQSMPRPTAGKERL